MLADEIKKCADQKFGTISLKKNSSNLFRPHSEDKAKQIDVRNFNKVLHVDKENLTAEVEGMTSYEDLVAETLKYSCVPTVVPELKSITIGGALSGCGIEASSFRYGLVHETIQETEILLGDGSIVQCNSTNEHKDLFFAFPNTFGTLGYALKIKVKLIPAKKYVKLTHLRFSEAPHYFNEIQRLCSENKQAAIFDYIDGVIFDETEMYITLGQFVDEVPFTSQYKYMNIYYQSIKSKKVDYLTTLDFIWRWDPDWFWCSKVFFMQNPILRFLFGKFMLNSIFYTKIMHFFYRHPLLKSFYKSFGGKRESIIQDIVIPIQKAPDFFDFFRGEIGIKPVWICPVQSFSNEVVYNFCPMRPDQLHVDFGFWDSVKTDKEEGFYNKKIEKKTQELNGFKSLYSSSYYTQEEFWTIYNKSEYQKIKQKYDPGNLLSDLYTKCTIRH